MSIIQEVGLSQIEQYLCEAIRRQVPVSLTYRVGRTWVNCHSKILKQADDKLWLEQPASDSHPEIKRGLPVGLSFKIKHHKHIFNTVVAAAGQFRFDELPAVRALCIPCPREMQRVQRRAYNRVEVPRNRSVLATFWRSGLGHPPENARNACLTWEGWVTNISAGGFQVRTASQGGPSLEEGDVAGVRIDFGQGYEPVLAEAQLRHQSTDDRGVTMVGFQFIGLNETAAGRQTLRQIGRIVCEFQRLRGRRRSRTVA